MYEDVWMSSRRSKKKTRTGCDNNNQKQLEARKNVKRIKKYRNLEKIAAIFSIAPV